ncbi:hypothetical protein ANCCAN_04756 [Ancylostoma caninum]|uniref:Uncharacterized protein n=1 Tax=Ancylostoma caninum TaxID=29170 RepID=A0A368GXU9_ANCCA|nr:hypothetical protein ANCCAN_04756 [Ancylostoma caninum]
MEKRNSEPAQSKSCECSSAFRYYSSFATGPTPRRKLTWNQRLCIEQQIGIGVGSRIRSRIKKLLAEGRSMEEMDEIKGLLRRLSEANIREDSRGSKAKQNVTTRPKYKMLKVVGQEPPKRTGKKRHKHIVEINKELLPYLFQGDINLTREQLVEMLKARSPNATRSTSL